MKLQLTVVSVTLLLAVAQPALAQQEKETVGSAVAQPLRDLSIIRQKTPDLLRQAALDPYARGGDCPAMEQEITALNDILGDELGEVNDSNGSLVTDVVKSAVRLPFSGVFRRITGAHKRDQAYQDAVIAGVARRAYLKGAMTACAAPPPVVVAEANLVIPLVPEPAVSVAAAP